MIDEITKYAQDVTDGVEVAGLYVRLACKRHLDELEKSKTDEFEYRFDLEKACKIIDFAEELKYTRGEPGFVGTDVKLHGFAKFILGSIFGWVHKETGYRKYRKAYIQMARKNIKTMLESVVAIYMSTFDNYEKAQVYCVATKMAQARLAWGQAAEFIKEEPDLNRLFKVRKHDAEIESLVSGGIIKALGRDTSTIDGFDPHCGIVDEYHAHKTNQMVKLLEDGAIGQKNFLLSIITTAGFYLNAPCFEEYEYCRSFLETGQYVDNYFCYIAQMDKDDDKYDSKNWIKANPLVATLPHGIKNIKSTVEEAQKKGGNDLRNLLTKTFNEWVQMTDSPFIKNYDDWKACATKLTLEDMRGRKVIVGLDLSSGGDLTSLNLEFNIEDLEISALSGSYAKYYIHSHSFLPKTRLQEHINTDKAPYDMWYSEGLITLTEALGGIKTDYKYIISYLKNIIEEYDLELEGIGYDPYNASAFLSDLEEFGVPLILVTQSAKNLSEPTEDVQLLIESHAMLYNENQKILSWSARNASVYYNPYGDMKIDKMDKKQKRRIDPLDALIASHKATLALESEQEIDVSEFATDEFLDVFWD